MESRHDQDLAQPYCASSENEKAASIFTLMKLVTLWKWHIYRPGDLYTPAPGLQFNMERTDLTPCEHSKYILTIYTERSICS